MCEALDAPTVHSPRQPVPSTWPKPAARTASQNVKQGGVPPAPKYHGRFKDLICSDANSGSTEMETTAGAFFTKLFFHLFHTCLLYQAVKMSVIWNLCDGMSNFSFKIPNLIIFCCVSQCYILKIYLWLLLNFFLCLHLSVGSYFNLFDVGKRLEPSAGQYFTKLF